jgi:DegV family protein with EDD domain
MARIAIVTDSTSDLMPDQAASAGIRVVPLFVRFGTEEFRAGIDLSTDQFWQRMLAPGAPIPATAAPPPGTFVETFEACFAEGAEAVVCPTIGSKISGTFQSATLAAQSLPDREIHVVDTGTTSMAQGIAALVAVEAAAGGAGGA